MTTLALISVATMMLNSAGGDTTPDWAKTEAAVLGQHVQLTSREMFLKAGEAYFSPDGGWVIFQAIPVPAKGTMPDSAYSMYVAKLVVGEKGPALSQITRVSATGSANTCGWFHPTRRGEILFGSTMVPPSDQQKSGFQVGSRKYVWMFPAEMEVVTTVADVVKNDGSSPASKLSGLICDGFKGTTAVFTRPNYDAECSYDATGRFLLYAHVEDAPSDGKEHRADANIYIFDTQTQKHIPIVTAPGYDGGPFFSPDGRSICYRSDRKSNDLLQLFVSDLKFERDEAGVDVPVGIEREYQITANESVNWAPYWHPSGKFLVYGSSEVSHANYEVFAIEFDREKVAAAAASASFQSTVIVPDLRRLRVTQAGGADVLPVFSHDGKWMMWTSQRGPKVEGEEKSSSQLWIAEWRGGVGADSLFLQK